MTPSTLLLRLSSLAVVSSFACACTIVTTSPPPASGSRPPAPAPAPPPPAPPASPAPAPQPAASYTAQYCQDAARRATACGQAPAAPAQCQQATKCSAAVMRPDAHPVMLSCIAARPCNRPDEACFIEVSGKLSQSPAAQAFTKICGHRQGACPGAVSSDLCHAGKSGAFTDAFYNAMGGCLAKTCDQISACVDQSMGALMPPGCSAKTMW